MFLALPVLVSPLETVQAKNQDKCDSFQPNCYVLVRLQPGREGFPHARECNVRPRRKPGPAVNGGEFGVGYFRVFISVCRWQSICWACNFKLKAFRLPASTPTATPMRVSTSIQITP